MILAIDFDGTIVEHEYPKIGKTKLFAFETLKELQNQGHKLILWSYRAGNKLDEAVDFCSKNGLIFYAVNANHPGEILDENTSRKIYADFYIDDRNIGGFLGWSKIWELLNENSPQALEALQREKSINEAGIISKIKSFFK